MAASREVLHQALDLPLKQRARLAQALLRSLDEDPPSDPEDVAKAWDAELARRVEDVRSGRVKTVPWSTVKKDLDRTIKSVRARRRRAR